MKRLRPRAAIAAVFLMCAASVSAASVWQRSPAFDRGMGAPPAAAAPGSQGRAGVSLFSGRVRLTMSNLDEESASALAGAIRSRLEPLFADGAWELPFDAEAPLQIRLAAVPGPSLSSVSRSSTSFGIRLNVSGHTPSDVAEEVSRNVLAASLTKLDPGAAAEVVDGFSRGASLSPALSESDREEVREAGASPSNSLERPESEIFAGLWFSEMEAVAGSGFLPDAWRTIRETGDFSFAAVADDFALRTGRSPEEMFRRSLERAYSEVSVLPDFSGLEEADLEAGALDASAPGPRAWRFFTFTPQRDGGIALGWPADGAFGFARIHYQGGLPADIVEFQAGVRKSLPLAGVTRIDWVVIGGEDPAASLPAPASVSPVAEFPYSGLSAHAEASTGEGVQLEWSTAANHDVNGWAILREELDSEGRITASSPEWVPAGVSTGKGETYVFVDSSSRPGHFYRYDVWAVTAEGALSRSFRVVVRAR